MTNTPDFPRCGSSQAHFTLRLTGSGGPQQFNCVVVVVVVAVVVVIAVLWSLEHQHIPCSTLQKGRPLHAIDQNETEEYIK
ncbi:uncharacterized protein BO97DRAFT_90646 [Aspergillus homomorphus CBS 101889]|uniref:Uncharacterized protein n=1 Tax=Aspergillus homomorphus (strain CBS 101889) TaxID=1450537 RepID=A0A395HVP5_ASPHC|nr:hypothetical protein BO97DRAFT_90646 [Aspergillus homomorphus CBS 101889]RAL11599.1 hypothetical protein BO97DRAFT_90646 [Aspergillus homomorphus CBS 101889]